MAVQAHHNLTINKEYTISARFLLSPFSEGDSLAPKVVNKPTSAGGKKRGAA